MQLIFLQSQNGHFEEMGACLQILQIVGNFTLFYLSFGSVFHMDLELWEKFESNLLVCDGLRWLSPTKDVRKPSKIAKPIKTVVSRIEGVN